MSPLSPDSELRGDSESLPFLLERRPSQGPASGPTLLALRPSARKPSLRLNHGQDRQSRDKKRTPQVSGGSRGSPGSCHHPLAPQCQGPHLPSHAPMSPTRQSSTPQGPASPRPPRGRVLTPACRVLQPHSRRSPLACGVSPHLPDPRCRPATFPSWGQSPR